MTLIETVVLIASIITSLSVILTAYKFIRKWDKWVKQKNKHDIKQLEYDSTIKYFRISGIFTEKTMVWIDGVTNYIYTESEGYVVDMYDDYIILNGRDFIDNGNDGHMLPIATYKIDTTLQTIEANTFVDTTSIIT